MTEENAKSGTTGIDLGLAGVALGCVLVLASLDELSPSAASAANCFAISIPLSVGSYFIQIVRDEAYKRPLKVILQGLELGLFVAAQIASVVGVYWMFRHVSAEASTLFAKTAAGCYLAAGVLYAVVLATNADSRKKIGQ
jgi:hypothetical protein